MKTKLGVVFGVCVALAFFAVPAFAAETGSAAGRVFDLATNAGVEGVTVVATCSVQYDEDQPYARVETTTGADGSYTLSRLLADRTYGLSFTKLGYIVEARYEAGIASGKTRRVSDIALCPIPVNHGVYRLPNDAVDFFQRFLADPSARPEHPLTYEPLPQATYTKIPVPGQEGKFTREFTVSREAVIPQILHKHERSTGEALLILFDADWLPQFRKLHEVAGSGDGKRRFSGEENALEVDPVFETRGNSTRVCLFYSGTPLAGGVGYCNLASGTYAYLVGSGEGIASFLFEVIDTVSGDDVTRCRNILTIMRHEIAAFHQQNGRWPTYEEFDQMKYDGHPLAGCFNPFCGNSWSNDADALRLKKGDSYVIPDEYETISGWLYSPSTGELWPATASGNGEAGW